MTAAVVVPHLQFTKPVSYTHLRAESASDAIKPIVLTKLIDNNAGKSLAETKHSSDDVLAGKSVTLTFATATQADAFCASAQQLGVSTRRETRYQ